MKKSTTKTKQPATAVKERPIIFSGPMVRAILENHKTQTRRIVKPQMPPLPEGGRASTYYDKYEDKLLASCIVSNENPTNPNALFIVGAMEFTAKTPEGKYIHCPYGKPGDHLWVRETWSLPGLFDDVKASDDAKLGPRAAGCVRYFADGKRSGKLRPSIFMPRWASRILLEVVSVRLERLHDITEADAIAEGCPASAVQHSPNFTVTHSARMVFAGLWDKINGKGAWDRNDWVWRVEFKVLSTTPTPYQPAEDGPK